MRQIARNTGLSGAFFNFLPLNETMADIVAGADESWAQNCFSLQNEISSFLTKRWTADIALPIELMKCRDLEDVTKVQQDWAEAAFEAYADEAVRLVDLAQSFSSLGLKSWFQTVKQTPAQKQSEEEVPLVMIE